MQIIGKVKAYFIDDDARYLRNLAMISILFGIAWANLNAPEDPFGAQLLGGGAFLLYAFFVFSLIDTRVRQIKKSQSIEVNIAIDPAKVADLETVMMHVGHRPDNPNKDAYDTFLKR